MEPIQKAKGLTDSEAYLALLSDQTFLDLWSYPNVFGEPGKELCDLLVVCGDHVMIFSDKSITWPAMKIETAWPRWYRRAIDKSVAQIRGAERWLKLNPTKIYLDAQCTQRLPLTLPPIERRIVHGICVALGAEEACKAHFDDTDGAFFVMPHLTGAMHTDFQAADHVPFAIGDVDPSGSFVHVFDRTSLDIVMRERDTVTDFARYLQKRAELIRGKSLLLSPSEAEMVANYMQTMEHDGHCFPSPADFGAADDSKIAFSQGEYKAFTSSAEYAAMDAQRKISRVWDKLIQTYSAPVLAGTTVGILDLEPSIELSERALRFMAVEPRHMRVAFGQKILEAVASFPAGQDRFVRILCPEQSTSDLAYIFMILAYPEDAPGMDYARYRRTRITILETYCYEFLRRFPKYKKAVGIAVDSPGSRGSSEDLIAVEAPEWTDAIMESLAERCEAFDVFTKNKPRVRTEPIQEYPEPAGFMPLPGHMRRKATKQKSKKR